MIFQEPMSSLNPSLKCGFQVEILLQHTDLSTSETKGDTFAIRKVKLPDPEIVFDKYPHEISGGQKQRVMIVAIANRNY
jgi:peptide/nickel transport system ATP-binding protein